MPVDQSPDETGRKVEDIEKGTSDVVVDRGEGKISDLWKKEDYWAIWLGFALLILGMIIYFPRGPEGMRDKINTANTTMEAEAERAPFKTIAWHKAKDSKKKLKATGSPIGKTINKFTSKPHGWSGNPLGAFIMSREAADSKKAKGTEKYEKAQTKEKASLAAAQEAEMAAEAAGFQNAALNTAAAQAIDS
jgi:hypothetical protein